MTLPFSLVTIKPCEGQVSESRILLKKKKLNAHYKLQHFKIFKKRKKNLKVMIAAFERYE